MFTHPPRAIFAALFAGPVGLSLLASGPTLAASIDTGADDVQIVWNNTPRYNWGMRIQGRDSRIADNAAFDQGDALFDRHDTITNRIDWLTEFDLTYRQNYGLRISAAAWYDAAYGPRGRSNPYALGLAAAPNSYVNNDFTSYVRRYHQGLSGELLDAFAFGAFDVGGAVVNAKLGRHAVVWGEALFGSTHAIAYSQAPSDGIKGVANPGASAKETALPVNQFSALAQINPQLSVLAQVGFEWEASRIPEGGTYFGVDGVNQGPNVNRLPMIKGDPGDLGLGVKWSPSWLDGTLGVYARRFDDKVGWLGQAAGGAYTRAVYAHDIDLIGVSLVKRVDPVLVGIELSHRHKAPLSSLGSAGPAGGYEGARGSTWHALLNGIVNLRPNALYDAANLAAELAWSRLDRVTDNPQLFRAKGYVAQCNTDATMQGCADKQFVSLTLAFTPTWTQVYPGVDIDLPIFFTRNLQGNAPTNGGGVEGLTTYKIGLTARVQARHQFDLAYTGYEQKIESLPGSLFGSRVLGAPLGDKGWLSFTYQTTF